MIDVREYIDARGRIPYRDWLAKLDACVDARVIASVLRMENGNFSAAKGVGSGVLELRLDFSPRLPCLFRQRWRAAGDSSGRRHQETPTSRY